MINSKTNFSGGVNLLPPNDKQQSVVVKKRALKDVQNQNGGFLAGHQGPLKVCRNKKLTTEHPSNPTSQSSLSNIAVNEHIVNARRRFELELGRGRSYNSIGKYADPHQSRQPFKLQPEVLPQQTQLRESNTDHAPVATSNNLTPPSNFSYGGSPIPNSLGKYANNVQDANSHKVSAEISHPTSSMSTAEQRMMERFIRLQKFLKQCDESYQRDYIETLLRVSPPELSRHAVELEKRAIQLTIEEGKELQRMKSLNILEKSSPTDHLMQSAQLQHSRT